MGAISNIIRWNKQIVQARHNVRDSEVWAFGEWWGKKCCDNSCYFANYVVANYPKIKCFWITSDKTNTSGLNSRVRIVKWKTDEARKILKEAAVLIVNQNLQDVDDTFDFNCSGAIIINLWHGVPWKKLGIKAVPRNKGLYVLYQAYVLKIQRFAGFLCPGDYEEIYEKAFLLKSNQILCAGQPRNALFYNKAEIEKCYGEVRLQLGIEQNSKIIAYLPTFRDSHTKLFSFSEIGDVSFQSWLEDNNIYIVQKSHTVESGSFEHGSDRIINVDDISAQELMAASDVLVTDYSSCFFDYLLLDRPIIHYLYDYDYYKNRDRGLYYDKEDVVCGSAPEVVDDLIEAIKENVENPSLFRDLRIKRKEKFLAYESENSCEMIAKRIIDELSYKYGLS